MFEQEFHPLGFSPTIPTSHSVGTPKRIDMNELIEGLINKVGLDKETAEQVVAFLKENADKLPSMLSADGVTQAVKDKLPGGLGGLFG